MQGKKVREAGDSDPLSPPTLYGHHGAPEVEWPRARAESEKCIEPPHNS